MAQIALRQELHAIFNELFTVGGDEIIFRKPEEYELSEGICSFKELEKRAASHYETALGIYSHESGNKEILMNPQRKKELTIIKEDRLIILTTY